VDHTVNIKCLHYGSHCRCLEDDESCCFFYFSFQKLLTHVGSGMAEKVWFTVRPKTLKIFFIFFIYFFKKLLLTIQNRLNTYYHRSSLYQALKVKENKPKKNIKWPHIPCILLSLFSSYTLTNKKITAYVCYITIHMFHIALSFYISNIFEGPVDLKSFASWQSKGGQVQHWRRKLRGQLMQY